MTSWIRGRLLGLVTALEELVVAISKDDHADIVLYMGIVTDIRKHIESQWSEMAGALERAEQTLRNLGDGEPLSVSVKTIALHEAENIRVVLDKQEEGDDESA